MGHVLGIADSAASRGDVGLTASPLPRLSLGDWAMDQLQPVLTGNPPNLTPADVTNRWGLLSEPWVFVVDRGGIVRGSFALIFSDAELSAALDKVR